MNKQIAQLNKTRTLIQQMKDTARFYTGMTNLTICHTTGSVTTPADKA